MKTLTYFSGVAALALVFGSCGGNSSTEKNSKPSIEQLTNNKEASKQQFFLRVVDEVETDSSKIFVAKSLFDKDTVGLKVEVLKNIQPGINADGRPIEDGFIKGNIKLSSIGVQSDQLLKALGTVFKTKTTGAMSSAVLLPTVFSSNNAVVDLSKQSTYNFKLFLDNTKGAPAEIFLNVDTYRKSIEISEKDSTYRQQIVSALEGK